MGLDVKQLGLYVVRPTLAALAAAAPGIDGPVAEALLLGTAAQESQFRYLHQEGGPALGLWQMEPATHEDIWRNVLRKHEKLAMVVLPTSPIWVVPDAGRLAYDLRYACAMARLLYWRDPEPLWDRHAEQPPVIRRGDVAVAGALWKTYKRVWNTEKGKATRYEFLANYGRLVAPHWPPES